MYSYIITTTLFILYLCLLLLYLYYSHRHAKLSTCRLSPDLQPLVSQMYKGHNYFINLSIAASLVGD